MLQSPKPIRKRPLPAEAPKFFDPATIKTRFYGHVLVGSCLDPEFKDGAAQWSVRCADLLAVHRCLGRADDPAVKEALKAEGWSI